MGDRKSLAGGREGLAANYFSPTFSNPRVPDLSANVITIGRYLRSLREWILFVREKRLMPGNFISCFRVFGAEQVIFFSPCTTIYIFEDANRMNRWKFKRDKEGFRIAVKTGREGGRDCVSVLVVSR